MTEASMIEPTEAEELAAIASGDAEAFTRWLREAEPRVRGSLRRFAAGVDVEAVLQESLLRAWQIAPRVELDGRGESLLRVTIRLARNLAVDELRRRGAAPEPEPEEPAALPAAPDPFLRSLIEACRSRLPRRPALALRARLEQGFRDRPAEIAVELGMRANTYLQNLARARKLLRACLESRGVDPGELPR